MKEEKNILKFKNLSYNEEENFHLLNILSNINLNYNNTTLDLNYSILATMVKSVTSKNGINIIANTCINLDLIDFKKVDLYLNNFNK